MQINKRILVANGALCLALVCSFSTPAKAMHVATATEIQEQEKSPKPAEETQLKSVVLTGTVVKNGADYFLRDSGGTLYQLDASEKAQPLEGKSVKVSGKLEANTNFVRVETIEAL